MAKDRAADSQAQVQPRPEAQAFYPGDPDSLFLKSPGGLWDRLLGSTNNTTEQSIGWNVEERYHTMRGYKRPQSVLNVNRLTAGVKDYSGLGEANMARVV